MTDPHSRLRALFETYLPAVRRYAYHRAIVGVDADDVVAETFLVAWRRLDAVPAADPLPWLLAVAANVRRNQLRGRYRYDAAIKRLPRPDIEYPPDEPNERAAGFWAAIGALDEDDREILRLVVWDGLTSEQAAVVLACRPGTARARLHCARRRLAALLDSRPSPPSGTYHNGPGVGGQYGTESIVQPERRTHE